MSKVVRITFIVAVLAASLAGAGLMFAAREDPERKPRVERGVAVETVRVSRNKHRLDVRAAGLVLPARVLDVHPEVSGRLTWLYQQLAPGTFVKKGQTLFRIDARDYQLGVRRSKADVRRARSALELEQGQQAIAKREWELFGDQGAPSDGGGLALRQPQREAVESEVNAARVGLAQAMLSLHRTSLAPTFDAVVVESDAEVGQLATPQTRLARLVGTSAFWVRVSIPTEQLAHVTIPGIDGEGGSRVLVRQAIGERTIETHGRVIRLLSGLEPSSLMARLLVEVDDPYGFSQVRDGGARPYPLLLGSYVEVIVSGSEQRELIELARSAVRPGNLAYVLDSESSTLRVRKLVVVWQLPDTVLVESGLSDGELVVTSPLGSAVDGMKLRDVTDEDERGAVVGTKEPTRDAGSTSPTPSGHRE